MTADRRRFLLGSLASAGLAASGAGWTPAFGSSSETAESLSRLHAAAIVPATLTLGGSSFAMWDGVLVASVPLLAGTRIDAITLWGENTSGSTMSFSAAVYRMNSTLSPSVEGTASIAPGTTGPTAATFAGIVGATVDSTGSLQIRSPFALSSGQKIHGVAVEHTPPASSTPAFVAASSPYRYDTRVQPAGRLNPDEERVVTLPVANGYTNAVFNLTITDTVSGGYVSVYRSGIPWPGNSNINWTSSGQTDANLVITPTTNGSIVVRAGVNPTHVILDFIGSLA